MKTSLNIVVFFGIVIGGLIFAAGFNWALGQNVGVVGGENPTSLVKRQISENLVLSIKGIFQERPYKKEMLRQKGSSVSVIVTGPSRVFLIQGEMLSLGSQAFHNAGVQAATLEDHLTVWKLCKDFKVAPELIFLELDPWLFNDRSGEIRWSALATDFLHAKQEYDNRVIPFEVLERYFWLRYHWLQVVDLLAFERLRHTGNKLIHRFRTRRPLVEPYATRLVDENEVPPMSTAFVSMAL